MKRIIHLVCLFIIVFSITSFAEGFNENDIDYVFETRGNRSIVLFKGHDYMGLTDENGKLIPLERQYDFIGWTEHTDDYLVVTTETEALDDKGYVISTYGLIDRNGNEVQKPVYDYLWIIKPNRILIENYTTGQAGIYTCAGQGIMPFESGYTKFENLEGYGMLPSGYWQVYDYGLFKVQLDGKYGITDADGNKLTDFIYDEFDTYYNHKTGYLKVKKEGYYGYLNKRGKEIIPTIYKNIYYDNGYLVAQNDDMKFALYSLGGNEILPFNYDRIYMKEYSDGRIDIIVDQNKKRFKFNPNNSEMTFIEDLDYELFTYKDYSWMWENAEVDVAQNLTAPYRDKELSKEDSSKQLDEKLAVEYYGYNTIRKLEGYYEVSSYQDDGNRRSSKVYGIVKTDSDLEPLNRLTKEKRFKDSELVIPLMYKRISYKTRHNLFEVAINENELIGVFDVNGEEILPPEYIKFGHNTDTLFLLKDEQLFRFDFATRKLTALESRYDVPIGDKFFKEDGAFIEAMSKYGNGVWDSLEKTTLYINIDGFTYYPKTVLGQSDSDVSARVFDNGFEIDFSTYNETIRSMLIDFVADAYPNQNDYMNALHRMFMDIESTKGIGNLSKKVSYGFGQLDDKTREIGDVSVSYENAGYFTVIFSLNKK